VPPLSQDGIGEAIEAMGYPIASLVSSVDFLETLTYLTEGDPLLVRMYTESLWKKGEASQRITPEELKKFDPGYSGLFKSWFEKQSGNWADPNSAFRKQLEAILAILSVALGPLEHRHLETVCGIFLRDQNFSLTMKDIEPIRRFLLGDGTDRGYSFQHPKFAQYFRAEYFKNGKNISASLSAIKSWSQGIVSRLNCGTIKPQDAPPYVLDHYVQHLVETADDPEAMESLLLEGWQRAWFEQDRGYVRYAADITALMDAFRIASKFDPERRFANRVRCGLILSSIRSLGINTPSELLVALVQHGKMSSRQALHRLRFNDTYAFANGLLRLFDFADPGTKIEILEAAAEIKVKGFKVEALSTLADRLPEPRRMEVLERALAAAEEVGDEGAKTKTLASLADRLREPRRTEVLERALAAAEGVGNDEADTRTFGYSTASQKAEALTFLDARLPQGLMERALTAAEGIGDEEDKVKALAALAVRLPEPRRTEVLKRALAVAKAIRRYGQGKAGTLGWLVERLPETLLEQALAAAEGIVDCKTKADVLTSLACRQPEPRRTELLEQALSAAEEIGDEWQNADRLGRPLTRATPQRRAGAGAGRRRRDSVRYA
jgi:hypothetical protein